MKDQSTAIVKLVGLKVTKADGSVFAIDELTIDSKMDYIFEGNELEQCNNAAVRVFEKIIDVSASVAQMAIADKKATRQHAIEMAILNDKLDSNRHERIHNRERYSATTGTAAN